MSVFEIVAPAVSPFVSFTSETDSKARWWRVALVALLVLPGLVQAATIEVAGCGGVIEVDFADQYAGCVRAPESEPEPEPAPPSGGACQSPDLPPRAEAWVCPGFSETTSVYAGAGFDIWHMGSTMVQGESLCISPAVSYTQQQWSDPSQTWRIRGSDFLILASPGAPVPPRPVVFVGNNIEWRGPIGQFTVEGQNVIVNGECFGG